VLTTSHRTARSARLADTVASIARWRNAVDVAVVMVFSGAGFVMADATTRAAKAVGLPVVLWLHGGNLPDHAARHPRWARDVLSRAKRVVAPSPYLRRTAASLGFKAVVVPNLLPLEGYPWRQRYSLAPRILWMRTFEDLYQPEVAVDVLDLLRRTCPRATLTMAGQDTGGLAGTRAYVHQKGLDGYVRFAGFLDEAGKRAALADHDLFLNTTRVDNTPVSLMEAAASGLPIVSTASGGIPDLFEHGRTALLADIGDTAAIAAHLNRLLADAELAGALSEAGRELASRSLWPAVRQRWEAVLGEAAGCRTS
jgi:glycosyltransferase involved in cell wall biosynthesis